MFQPKPIVIKPLSAEREGLLPIGNGSLGASVRVHDDKVTVLLNHQEAWLSGEATDNKEVRLNHFFNLGSVGLLVMRFPGRRIDLQSASATLFISNGLLHLNLGFCRLHMYIHAETDLLVGEVLDCETDLTLSLESWREDSLLQWEGDALAYHYANSSSPWERMNERVGMRDWKSDEDPFLGRSWTTLLRVERAERSGDSFHYCEANSSDFNFLLSVAISRPKEEKPLGVANKTMCDFEKEKLSSRYDQHMEIWQNRWGRGFVDMSSADGIAQALSSLYALHLYQVFASATPSTLAKFNGALFLAEPDERPWGGAYWYQNMRLIYWPLLSAGWSSYIDPFFNLPTSALGFLREQTPRLFSSAKGVYLPETMGFWGWADFANLESGYRHPYIDYYHSTGIEWLCFFAEYLERGDCKDSDMQGFLQLAEEVLSFLSSIAQRDASGVLHFAPSNCLETYWKVKDPLPLIAGIKALLPRLIKFLGQYGGSERLKELTEYFADHLPSLKKGRLILEETEQDIPNKDLAREGFHGEGSLKTWRVVGMDSDVDAWMPAEVSLSDYTHNWENPALYAIYPFAVYDPFGPEAITARNTFEYREQSLPWLGWSQHAVQAARLGLKDEALRLARHQLRVSQTFDFGGMATPGNYESPNLDTSGVLAHYVGETLLQIWPEGVIFFPALPDDWTGCFRLYLSDTIEFSGTVQVDVISFQVKTKGNEHLLRYRLPDSENWINYNLCVDEPLRGSWQRNTGTS